jgi:hypothetical protein
MKHLVSIGVAVSAFWILLPAESTRVQRDPFWPIGYSPAEPAIRETPPPVEKVPEPATPTLTDEALRQLALDEAERIRENLAKKGTMITGDRIYAYVNDKWVTIGDTLTVEVRGNSYQLEILNLTSNNIELEAHPTTR